MKPITVYTWQDCPFCIKAKDKLKELGLNYTEVTATPEVIAELRTRIGVNKVTVPQIYVGEYRVGGWSDMDTLLQKNLFHVLLED